MATIILSSTLIQYAKQQGKFEVAGKTLFGVLLNMVQKFPHLRPHLFDIRGDLTRTDFNFYLNEENIITKRWHNIPIKAGDVISILLSGRGQGRKSLEELQVKVPKRNESRDRLKIVH